MNEQVSTLAQTKIFKLSQHGEEQLGYLGPDQVIYKVRWEEGVPVGRVDDQGQIFRKTTHDERELGALPLTAKSIVTVFLKAAP